MTTRRLAAILAADIVGFSRLMGQDEEGTLARIKQLRREVVEPKVREHHGRVFKTMGDGLLVEFASPVEAVRCAAAVQETVGSQAPQEPSPALQLRIGINLGDIIIEEDGDVYGDGVNVAARMEQLAEAGGISISGKVYEEVRDKLPYAFEDRGEQQVKNIARPVRVYALRGLKPTVTPWEPKGLPLSDRPSIAVLPFTNMSGDPEQVYFSDGISEDVITELSRFRELMVIARNSSFSFRERSVDVREIGRSLGAAYVLQGTVRRAGNRVRITTQLVDAASGVHRWSERYDRAIEDVFALQEEIAQNIVATVAQRVVDYGEAAAQRRPPEDIRAYDLFLKALRLGGLSFTPEALAKVEALYQQALAIDPTFARAYSGLAYIHRDRSANFIAGVRPQPDEHLLSALRLAERALALDPNDPRVHCTLGMMCAFVRNFERAERHLDLAREMNPNDAVIQIFWAWMEGVRGKPERGLAAAEMAYRLNPRHPVWYDMYLARLHFQLEHFGVAAALLEKRLWDIPARNLRDMGWRVSAYAHQGRLDEAALCGDELVREIASHWRGDPAAGPSDYMDWIVWASLLQQPADIERLRKGLRLAGLPA
jgi:TolB-like protein/class 3 adenylate cyclase